MAQALGLVTLHRKPFTPTLHRSALPFSPHNPAASPPLPIGSHNLRVLQTATFHDAVSADAWGMALLGDMETNSLDCSTCPIRFCQPWAQRALSLEHWRNLELMIHMYLNNFIHQVKQWAEHLNLTFPFVIQGSIGCELHLNGTSRGFYTATLEGEDFVSFDRDTQEWVAWQEDELTRYVRDSLNRDKGTVNMLHFFLNTTCINDLGSFLRYRKEALERQEHPVAVVFAWEPPLTPGLLTPSLHLVCQVMGFHPQPVHVSWLCDGEKVAPGPQMSSTGILPNADLTYQLRSALAVAPEDGHRYACQVEHSSLQAGGLIIPWGRCTAWISSPNVNA
ncbi:antigen-presenting glycoprotein CD1d-like [Alligator sinensis]|uniref:Antigen-presenting glycoprotein CD1d-like n=1 Tax=Alligator sinensis TaxID=38654 RepID=A0A3Q0FLG2_ALLSI|nr:antigen-presenting glycoprotein CD1d-like [Alligator sinensis]XP_025048155.1 antigen-presenting glycoprotein CD1d-like [Alligator sinensis]